MREMTREQVVVLIRRRVAECGTLRGYCARHGVHISTLSNMLHGRSRFTGWVLRLLGLEHVRIVEQVEDAPVESVREMTRGQVEAWVWGRVASCGNRLSRYARMRQLPLTTLMNTLKRLHAWTPYTLRAVGLDGVRVVADVKAVEAPAKPVRPYRPMWRLGDWPKGLL